MKFSLFKQTKNKICKFYKDNKIEFIVLLFILVLAAILRFYKIDQYLTFLGDEGRDVIIVRRFLVYGDVFLIGPGTSIGNMYLGPLYYYMMALPLWLFNYSPVGPAVMVASLSIVTVWFVYYVGREWFGKYAGLIASFLYAIAPTVIIYSRSSWNPNIMPFFALLCIYAIYKAVTENKMLWLPVLGISYAFVLQSHYLGLLLAPPLFLFWLYGAYIKKRSNSLGQYLIHSIVMVGIFAILMSPLLVFDSRHGWRNLEALEKFFIERQTTVSARPWNALPLLWPLAQEITSRLVAGKNEVFGSWVALGIIAGAFLAYSKKRPEYKTILALIILTLWLGSALVGLGLYKQEIYDHYYGFFFAAPFLLIGAVSQQLISRARVRGTWLVATFLIFIIYFNFIENPFKYPPNNQLGRTRMVAHKIEQEANGELFNLAVLAERNYEAAYQYFLEKWDSGVVKIDPLNAESTITTQLFVVCELPREKCEPTTDPKTEIANFGWSKVEDEWEVGGVVLFRLVHNR